MHILYRTSSWAVLILVAAFAFAQLATAAGPGIFSPAGNMVEPRVEATATLLPNGKVLIAGGGTLCCSNGTTASAELYDPNAGTFTATGNMTTPRQGATAVLLANGKVLIASGGEVYSQTATAELYDPTTGTFSATGSMLQARRDAIASILPNGTVLIVGGFYTACNCYLSSAEIYDPSTGQFTATGNVLTEGFGGGTATLLQTGQVLFSGGGGQNGPEYAENLYNEDTGGFTLTGNLVFGHFLPSVALLVNGEVLIAGSEDHTTGVIGPNAELYDPVANSFSATGSLVTGRYAAASSLLPDGTVLVTGGLDVNYTYLTSAEVYNPTTGTFASTGSLATARFAAFATLLPNGKVLVAGGDDSTGTPLASAELYGPAVEAQVEQPINPDGSSVFNVSRGVVPVKFALTSAGVATCELPPATISLNRTAGAVTGSIDESTYLLASDTGSGFRISGCQYVYNLATRSLGAGTYQVNISIAGTVVGGGTFALK